MPARRRLASLLPLLLLSASLAGCLGGADDEPRSAPPTGGGQPTPPATTAPTATVAPAPENRAPVALLNASVTAGHAPLVVRFVIDGTDADDDTLTWNLKVDGATTPVAEGYELPATYNHSFADPGLHVVVLSVSDTRLKSEANLTINVSAAPAPPVPEPVVFHGVISGVYTGLGVLTSVPSYLPATVNHTFGLNVSVASFTASIDFNTTHADLDFAVWSPDGVVVGSSNNIFAAETAVQVTAPATGQWAVEVRPAFAVEAAYTVTVAFA